VSSDKIFKYPLQEGSLPLIFYLKKPEPQQTPKDKCAQNHKCNVHKLLGF